MIAHDAEKRIYHLCNGLVSCVLTVREDRLGRPELLMPYFGAALRDPSAAIFAGEWHEHASFDPDRQVMPYAVPAQGRGDYRPAMLRAVEPDGACAAELFFTGAVTRPGKPALDGLPSSYTEADDEAETLTLTLRDERTGLEAALSLTLFAGRPVLASSMRLSNGGARTLTLENAASLCLHLPGRWDMIHLHGGWAKERQVERVPASRLTRRIESVRGASGHEHNPFAVLAAPDATEFAGECVGAALVWSGDFRIEADENAYGTTRLLAGADARSFRWQLRPGETFQTPEALAVWSAEGLNGMSQALHSLVRERVCRGYWRDRERPVLLNNWEATYFDFNEERILAIARQAAEAGVELFVLDDGWFGHRDNDNCSLGDWVADRRKLPGGIAALARKITAMGLRFGLWFEPEMVSPDSDLYRAHPDWCLHAEGRARTEARSQLILDMSRAEVQDYVIRAVGDVLSSAPVGYVKWDMNRNFMEAGSAEPGRFQGEVHHRYMLGVYRVMRALTEAFPEVLFEGCSGGGGRFDLGMLAMMPQFWTSDDTDGAERLRIQYGTSLCYPASAMGAHVSAVPNHQLGRVTPASYRADVALGGNFGLELDLAAQPEEDMAVLRQAVERVKRLRRTTARGRFTRLLSPFEGEHCAWSFEDDERLILCVYRRTDRANDAPLRVRLRGLDPDAVYRAEDGAVVCAPDLMHAGVDPRLPRGDFASSVLVYERVDQAEGAPAAQD